MRVEKTIKNIKIAMLYQITILLIGFMDRKLFLSVLGVNFLGLHGLFGNIITMLSLAELGVGTAIIYNLYKPLEEQDQEEVAALMQLYKKVYYVIGIVIGVIGMILMFFLPVLIKEPMQNMTYVKSIYLIFLAGTVFTYLTGYKRAILYADQKNYILLLGDMVGNTIGVMAKVITLFTLKNYMAYVVIHGVFKVLPNIWASYQVNKLYPYINKIKTTLSLKKLQQVKQNIKDLFIHKISHFVVTSTDSLIISSFIGISAVGYLANYNMIIGALMGFIAQGVEALQASMGNLVVSRSKEKVEEVYDRVTFASFWIGSFCAVALVCLVQPFMKLWLGEDYFLQNGIVMIIIINFFLWILTRPLWQMMTVAGLFKEDKINAIVEIVVNLVVSLVLVQRLGLIGVLIGTMISYIVAWIMKSHLLYRKFFKKSYTGYYVKMVIYSVITAVEVMITYGICKKVSIANEYIRFVMQVMVCVVVPNVMNYVLFIRTSDLKYFEGLIKGVMMEIIEKLRTQKMVDRIQKLIFILMGILLLVSPMELILPQELTILPKIMIVGKLSARLVFVISGLYIFYLLMISDIWSKSTKKIVGFYIVIVLAMVSLLVVTKEIEAAKVTFKMMLVFNTALASAYIDYKKIGKWIYLLDMGFLTYILAIIWHYMNLENKPSAYGFIFNNPNYLGLVAVLMILMCFLAYGITNSKRYFVYVIPFIWMINMSRSRTSLLALIVAVTTYFIWKLLTKNMGVYVGFFVLIIVGIMMVTLVYPYIGKLAIDNGTNNQIIETMGKRLFTGREKLWIESIDLIRKKPILGYGMDATLESLTGGYLSTHNVYLQLLLQGGIILLLPFLMVIGRIWKALYEVSTQNLARIGAVCLVAILVIGTFELLLLEKIISLGIIQWFIIGVGLSPALYNKANTKDLKELN